MKYAVLGTGMVGHTLSTKLVGLGHEVRKGSRITDNENAAAWASKLGGASGYGAQREVSVWADRVIFAVNGAQIEAAASAVGNEAAAGKTVIDVTNPLDMSHGMPPVLVAHLSNTTSAGEILQAALPDAKVVKTLNTMNHRIMVDPSRVPGVHDVFLCSDHDDAKAEACEILAEFGWSAPIDLGPLAAARGTEGLMPFWLRMSGANGNFDFNYRIVRASPQEHA